jgi:hypothetical protein
VGGRGHRSDPRADGRHRPVGLAPAGHEHEPGPADDAEPAARAPRAAPSRRRPTGPTAACAQTTQVGLSSGKVWDFGVGKKDGPPGLRHFAISNWTYKRGLWGVLLALHPRRVLGPPDRGPSGMVTIQGWSISKRRVAQWGGWYHPLRRVAQQGRVVPPSLEGACSCQRGPALGDHHKHGAWQVNACVGHHPPAPAKSSLGTWPGRVLAGIVLRVGQLGQRERAAFRLAGSIFRVGHIGQRERAASVASRAPTGFPNRA